MIRDVRFHLIEFGTAVEVSPIELRLTSPVSLLYAHI